MTHSKPLADRATTSSRQSPQWFGKTLSSNNSLNLIRFVLAASVLVFHSFPLTGRGDLAPQLGGQGIGDWAVSGFFAVSGYLITASRQRTGFANYLLLRVGRIYPAFFVVMLVTVGVFAPLAHHMAHGSFAGYLSAYPTPLSYLYKNLFLNINQFGIGDTLASVPVERVWNGSLWTLYFEFLCYLFVGVLLIWKRAKTSVWPVAISFAVSTALFARPDLLSALSGGDESFSQLFTLLPYFLGGALIRLLSPRIGIHWIAGVVSLSLLILGVNFGPIWAAQLLAPLYAYSLLWLSTVIPQPKWVAKNDISYGVYIYAFPIQQLLVVFGMRYTSITTFSAVALGITVIFATASWYLVERPALRRTRVATGKPEDR